MWLVFKNTTSFSGQHGISSLLDLYIYPAEEGTYLFAILRIF
jgi:hypothetical protein